MPVYEYVKKQTQREHLDKFKKAVSENNGVVDFIVHPGYRFQTAFVGNKANPDYLKH